MKQFDQKALRLAASLLLLLIAGLFQSVFGQQESLPALILGQPLERSLSGGETQRYQVSLAAGECAVVELDTGEAHVYWRVWPPEGNQLAGGDLEKATQKIWLFAEHATTYFLEATPASSKAPARQYRLRLTEQRPATDADRNIFEAEVHQQQAVSFYGQNDESSLRQAVAHGQAAAARWDAAGHLGDAATSYNLLGMSLLRVDEITAATQAFEQALKRFQTLGNRSQAAKVTNNLSAMLIRVGEAQRALDYLSATLDEHGPPPSLLENARAHVLAGIAYKLLGDLTKARSLLERGWQLVSSEKEPDFYFQSAEGQALYELGRTCCGLGDYGQALAYLRQALVVAQGNDYLFRVEGCKIRRAMGDVYFSLGDYPQAQALYREALTALQEVGGSFHRAAIRNDLGATALALGKPAEAREWYAEALALSESLNNVTTVLPAQVGLARAAQLVGDTAGALARIEQALRLIESQRASIVSPDLRATFLATKREAYELHLDLLTQLSEQEKSAAPRAAAFAASEQIRARSFLELISASAGQRSQTTDPQLAARESELRQRISLKADAQTRLSGTTVTPEQQARGNNELTLLLAEYDRVITQIRQRDPRFAALTKGHAFTLAEIQQQVLDEHTVLLEYALGAERSYLFVVTPAELQTFVLPPRAEIEQRAHRFHELLAVFSHPPVFKSVSEKLAWQRQQVQAQEAAAVALSRLLLTPAQKLLSGKRLLIVPDGALHYVPFGALPEPERERARERGSEGAREVNRGGSQKVRSQGLPLSPAPQLPHAPAPLIAGHEILTLPSASTLAVLRRELGGRTPAPKTLAVFADPVFSLRDERVTAQLSLHRNPDEVTGNLPRLPATRREAEAIAALVAPSERKLALDFSAQRAAVLSDDLHQYRYVHFATHGLLDNAHPALSALALSQVDPQGRELPGYLRTLDVFNLRLNAELVVLSGCRTGLGKELNGEGLLSLSRGFMYAGARRVLASLWQVNDAATAELMRRFYQGVLGEQKLTPAAALRQAQLTMLKDARYRAPYYWAAFTLQGEW